MRLTRGLEIYCHIEGKIHPSFQNESPSNHLEMKVSQSFQNERSLINLKLIFNKSERRFQNESHRSYRNECHRHFKMTLIKKQFQ